MGPPIGDNPSMSHETRDWRCRRTQDQTVPGSPAGASDACWIQPLNGPRLAISRPGGCLADTLDDAGRCIADSVADDDEPAQR
jgi:hypothetical protein